MPVKIIQAYNVDPTAGDEIADDDVIAFEKNLDGTNSTSFGAKYSQLVSYLSSKFYRQSAVDSLLFVKMNLVTSPTEDFAVTQTAGGGLKSAGLPLATLEKSTKTVVGWGQSALPAAAHDLSIVPDYIHITGIFTTNIAGWTTGDRISLGLGDVAPGSALTVELTSTTYQVYNSCTDINAAILVPDKATGTNASVVIGSNDINLELTFLAIL